MTLSSPDLTLWIVLLVGVVVVLAAAALTGRFRRHPGGGRGFAADYITVTVPLLVAFLVSDVLPGVSGFIGGAVLLLAGSLSPVARKARGHLREAL